jgi:hypothetical protein
VANRSNQTEHVHAEDLFYVEIDNLIEFHTNGTSTIAKTRLKTLKKWRVEDEYDSKGTSDVGKFMEDR